MKAITSGIENLTCGTGTLSYEQKMAFVLIARKLDSIEQKLDNFNPQQNKEQP